MALNLRYSTLFAEWNSRKNTGGCEIKFTVVLFKNVIHTQEACIGNHRVNSVGFVHPIALGKKRSECHKRGASRDDVESKDIYGNRYKRSGALVVGDIEIVDDALGFEFFTVGAGGFLGGKVGYAHLEPV